MRIRTFVCLAALSMLAVPLSSCGDSAANQIYVRRSAAKSFVIIGADELTEMVGFQAYTASQDFILMVYLSGCSACMQAETYLAELAKDEHLTVYAISYVDYSPLTKTDETSYPQVSGTPTFFFYGGGKPVYTMEGIGSTYDSFKSEIMAHVRPAQVYWLNDIKEETGYNSADSTYVYDSFDYAVTSSLVDKIASDDDVYILFTWDRCTDCSSLFDSYLLSFLDDNPSVTLYAFEVDYFRVNKPAVEPADQTSDEYAYWKLWSDFASEFGFGAYENGKVPTLVRYQGGAFSSMIVYHNNGKAVQNSDGTYSYPKAYNSEVSSIKAGSESELAASAEQIAADLMTSALAGQLI